jgi:hypothetical protein
MRGFGTYALASKRMEPIKVEDKLLQGIRQISMGVADDDKVDLRFSEFLP